ncbi:MAG: hypothetical protein Q9225_001817 [Loekoesia sp. 1 TL-2023]
MSASYERTPHPTPTTVDCNIPTSGRSGSHDTGLSLIPEVVIGSTISSINALSASVDTHSFAFCAGSTVVLATVNSQLGLDQRLFCVKPDALPAQATPSYYNPATPAKAAGNSGHTSALFRDENTSGSVPIDHNVDSPSRVKSAHRSRSLTSVSLSPSGKFLAIGETGYRPRILVFSTESTTPTDVPLACLTEHTFGIRALAFSSDSRWLCSLGDLHDGGLFLWSINPKTGALRLDSSNRCTTAETIAWMGTSVVSVGTRNVKIWRLERPPSPSKARRGLDSVTSGSMASPVPRTFVGRNCLLGPLKEATFTCVVGISEDKAVLGTQDGAVCVLDDANRSQHLYRVSKKNYCITCVTLDRSSGIVWLGGHGVEPEALSLDDLHAAKDPPATLEEHSVFDMKVERKNEDTSYILAICCVENRIITSDNSRNMRIYDVAPDSGNIHQLSVVRTLPGHNSTVLGVVSLAKPNETQSDFLTYSERGHVLHWLWNGICTGRYLVQLDQPLHSGTEDFNELRIVRIVPTNGMLLAGDKAGLLLLLSPRGEAIAVTKAHDGEVSDLTLRELEGSDALAASCGKDKTIQIFRISEDNFLLQQSIMNEHAGSIRGLEFADEGSVLVSMSLDRTLVFHRKVLRTDGSIAFVSTKVVNFKASPIAMSLLPDVMPNVLVSATDRCIRKVNVVQGRITNTFKISDQVNSEPVAMSRLSVGRLDQQSTDASVLVGFSLADRSIRVYDLDTESLLALEYGQTAVSDLAFVKALGPSGGVFNKIISTGLDGTIMVWRMTQKSVIRGDGSEFLALDPSQTQTPSKLRPLRRVLSKTEIAEYQRSLEIRMGGMPISSRNSSPSRLRRKTSRHVFPDTFEVTDSSLSTNLRPSHTLTGNGTQRNKVKHASPSLSPKSKLHLRPRRSLLDERHREAAAKSTCNINIAATQLFNKLRDFQKQLTTSKESLSSDTAQALQKELHATLNSLAQKSRWSNVNHEGPSGESFDDFLAKLIDDRLALRFKPEDQTNTTEGSRDN